MKRLFLALALYICTASARAQHHIVIADMDTRLPLTGAIVSTDAGERAVSNHKGVVTLERAARSATVSAKNYMQRRVGIADLTRDTVMHSPEAWIRHAEVAALGQGERQAQRAGPQGF